jgi:exonuclease 3'-5' domain-containing protein 1
MDRPLSTQLLNYAAHDIYAIAALYEHFRVVKYIPKDCTSLLRWSNRYISVHLARGPPHRDDIYRKGPFLPLDIITSPSGPQVECKGCMRSLSASHFELDSRKERTIAFCRVCEAMKVKANNDAKKAEEAANKAAVCKQRLVAQAAAHAKTDVRGQATAAAVEGGL